MAKTRRERCPYCGFVTLRANTRCNSCSFSRTLRKQYG